MTERRKKEIASLSRRKNRDRTDTFVVEGVRSVRAALEADVEILEVLVSPSLSDMTMREEARGKGHDVLEVSEKDLARISDVRESQGVLLVARKKLRPASSLVDLSTILVLDGVQDPGNVGTLLRTAAWFGVQAVVAGPGTADYYNSKVVRSSMGGLWDLVLSVVVDLPEWLQDCRNGGYSVYCADLDGTDVSQWLPGAPSILVIGSEALGVSISVRSIADGMVSISGSVGGRVTESLNAAVAGGIIISSWVNRD